MDPPLALNKEESPSTHSETPARRPGFPVSSCVSLKSNVSMDPPLTLNKEESLNGHRKTQAKRSASPVDSCISMKSDRSFDSFKNGGVSSKPSKTSAKRPDSPVASCASLKSNMSMDPPLTLNKEEPASGHSETPARRPDSPVFSCVSLKSNMSMDPPLTLNKEEPPSGHSETPARRPDSPVFSCVSLKSNMSMDPPLTLNKEEPASGHSETPARRPDSPVASCVSLKSNMSMDPPLTLNKEEPASGHSETPARRPGFPVASCVSLKSNMSMDPPLTLNKEEPPSGHRSRCPDPLLGAECTDQTQLSECPGQTSFKSGTNGTDLSGPQPLGPEPPELQVRPEVHDSLWGRSDHDNSIEQIIASESPNVPPLGAESPYQRSQVPESADVPVVISVLHQTLNGLFGIQRTTGDQQEINMTKIECISGTAVTENEALARFKSRLRESFQCLNETVSTHGNSTLLRKVFTELYITEGDQREINNDHEVQQIEDIARKAETPIMCNDIFKPLPEQDKDIKTVMTTGISGIGKTVSVQKFILDWAEGKANQDIDLIFPLPFRELNRMHNENQSLTDMLHSFFIETKEMNIFSMQKILFIFDGLDECRLHLDFQNYANLADVNQSSSVDVLLTNLIRRNLLPSALLWITSRPAAAEQIPFNLVDRVTMVQGFNDEQKKKYFRKKIPDKKLAKKIFEHLKESRSLFNMCHIPVFCWISATVLEKLLGEARSGEVPKTVTQMYTHFLVIQINIIRARYSGHNNEEIISKLCHLAFHQLMKGNLIFYENDMRDSGIDLTEASVYSGVCTQIFRTEFGFCQNKVYCFVHLSIQEHLAALHVHQIFIKKKTNILKQGLLSKFSDLRKRTKLSDVHKAAVTLASESNNGCLDLFLRFLLGLSLESNITLFQDLDLMAENTSYNKEEIVQYIKKRIRKNTNAEKCINLFHCLNELGDNSMVENVQHYLKSKTRSTCKLSSSQWMSVVLVLLTSAEELNEFVLKEYGCSEKILQKLLPVVAASRVANLHHCNLTKKSCSNLASILSSVSSAVRELALSENEIEDSGVKLLCAGLKNPHCKLEILWLWKCGITHDGCASLAVALSSQSSHLKLLDLSANKLEDSGVNQLCSGLINPHCKLETLRMKHCGFTEKVCANLALVLKSNPSHLRSLNLSKNALQDSGVKLLCAEMKSSDFKLEKLRLKRCDVTHEGCSALASVLTSNPFFLKELNLSVNSIKDSGVKLLCDGLANPDCKLEILKLKRCDVTHEGCSALASVLTSNPCYLKELNLSENSIKDSGVKLLCDGLANPDCKLEILRLKHCSIGDEGFAAVSSALQSNLSHLRALDMTSNKETWSGQTHLNALKNDKHSKLQELKLDQRYRDDDLYYP